MSMSQTTLNLFAGILMADLYPDGVVEPFRSQKVYESCE